MSRTVLDEVAEPSLGLPALGRDELPSAVARSRAA